MLFQSGADVECDGRVSIFCDSHGLAVGFSRRVRFRLSIYALFFAWLCASGGLLDLAQVFAWTRMYAGYAQTMSAGEALTETFDPAKPCKMCVALLKARKASDDSSKPSAVSAAAIEKVVLIAHRAEFLVLAPDLEMWPVAGHTLAIARVDPVPTPPPRGGAGSFIV